MSPQFPSIQSFFQPEVSPTKKIAATTPPSKAGDGFTVEEIEATLQPKLHKWQPRSPYNEVEIGSLVPGPGCVVLMGRVVNFYDQATPSKAPQAAKGCLKMIVKDDSGALMVLPACFLVLYCHLPFRVGQAMVRKGRLPTTNRPAGVNLDSTRFKWGFEFFDAAAYFACNLDLPRARQ